MYKAMNNEIDEIHSQVTAVGSTPRQVIKLPANNVDDLNKVDQFRSGLSLDNRDRSCRANCDVQCNVM